MTPNDRTEPGVCPECKGAGSMFEGSSGLDAKVCRICKGTGQQPATDERGRPMTYWGGQPAQPGSVDVGRPVRRYWAEDLPSQDVEVVFAQDFDRLQSALTAARREIAAITAMAQAQRDCKPPYTSWSPAGMHQMLVQLHDLILKEPS